MTVIKRGNSYWIDIGFNNHRYRKRSPDKSYKGAQAYELFIRQKLARGEPLEKPTPKVRLTFKETALEWFEVYVKTNNKASEITNKHYVLNSSLIPYFGKKYIDEINSYDIEKYKRLLLNEHNLSPKTINNRLCILSCLLRSAIEWSIINTMPKIKLQRVPPQPYDYLTEIETEKLLQHATGLWHDMILLTVRTGLRFGELIALQWADINFKDRFLTVNRSIVRDIEGSPKSNKARTIPLVPSVLQMLGFRARGSKYIFHDKKGAPLKHDFCCDNLHEICKQAGLRTIGWHKLRHSFASHLASKNNSIVAIKELLGHSDIKTTMRYAHVNLPVLQNAIESLEPAFKFNDTITAQPPNRVPELDSRNRSVS